MLNSKYIRQKIDKYQIIEKFEMESHIGIGVGKYIEKELFLAKKSMLIISPGISLKIGEKIFEHIKNGIETKILTGSGGGSDSLETNKLAMEIMKKNKDRTAYQNLSLEYRIIDKEKNKLIHPKIYIIDDSCAIIGSANLTYNGFNNFVEYIQIFRDSQHVEIIKNDFEKLWDLLEKNQIYYSFQ